MEIKREQILEINSLKSLGVLREHLDKGDTVALDTETTGLDCFKGARPFMLTAYTSGAGFVLDKRRVNIDLWNDVALATFGNPKLVTVGHNFGFDKIMARAEWGIRVTTPSHDTLLQAFLLDENRVHKLKVLAEKRWGEAASRLDRQVQEWLQVNNGGKKNYDKLPFELCSHYATQDTFLTYHLDREQRPLVEKDFATLYLNERKLINVLCDMRWAGVRLDVPYLRSLIPKYEQELGLLQNQIHGLAGREFNISSDAQLGDTLYRKLGIQPKVYTPSGKPSTDKEALVGLDHPIGKLILAHRDIETSLHTFVNPWLEYADTDGYLHPSLNQTGARSGRFSSSAPNIQQIPKRTPSAKQLRKAFIYPDGVVGGATDQSQVEMAGFAHYSGDPVMRKALQDGRDLHKETAAMMGLSTSAEEVSSDQRKLGKGSNFAVIFGCGRNKLASFLSQDMYAGRPVSPEEAADLIARYKRAFPAVDQFTHKVIHTVKFRPGNYVQNMFGRRCRLGSDKAYIGVNRLIQSWAGDFMKRGMVRAWEYAQGTDLRLNVNVHDELKWYCKEANFLEHARKINEFLTDCPGLSVPVRTETTRSKTSWADEEVVKL